MEHHQQHGDWNAQQETLRQLRRRMADGGTLGEALRAARRFVEDHHYDAQRTRLEEIEADYRLMCDFLLRGYPDAKREELYGQLFRRLYRLVRDIELDGLTAHDARLAVHVQHRDGLTFETEAIRRQLEAFVSDVAVSSLEPDEARQSRLRAVYDAHHAYTQRLFDAMVFSHQWSRDFGRDMAELLVSPTVDAADAQLLVTALMLGAMNQGDPERLLALTEVYAMAQDEHVRQRALVGWAFALDDEVLALFPRVAARVRYLLDAQNVRQELLELQMQVVYCRNAERDHARLQQDVMPTLMKNRNLEITRFGIKEKDEDALEDILHPDAADKKMEEMERSIRKMMDMRRQGADIYFGGFSQMKRFSFFYTLSNWFVPFSPDHPQLRHLPAELLGSAFMAHLFQSGPFCDSDKYSFALGLSTVFANLPANIREMLLSGEATMEIAGDGETDLQSPAYMRRMYLQDLYRFFRLSDFRTSFADPFADSRFLLMQRGVCLGRMGEEARRVQRFLLKQQMYGALSALFYAYKQADRPDDMRMEALLCMHEGQYFQAQALYARLCELQPDDEQAVRGYARASFRVEDYHEAAESYGWLCERHPDQPQLALSQAIALINDGRAEEGQKMLFRLAYEQPDNLNVERALAWGHLWLGHADQAARHYRHIVESKECTPADCLNAGYAQWFMGHGGEAVELMKRWTAMSRDKGQPVPDVAAQFQKDAALLDVYGIPAVDRRLIAGLVE